MSDQNFSDTDPRAYLTDPGAPTLDEIAAEVTHESGAADVRKLTSGLEREGSGSGPVDPAQYLDKEPSAPGTVAPARRSGGGGLSGPFVHTVGMSNAHHKLLDARRRPDGAALGEPRAAAKAWQSFLEKADAADAAFRDVPLAVSRAAQARSEAASSADGPVVLPSVQDARAVAEAAAAGAIREALELRAEYDRVVESTGSERAALLAKSVPAEAAKIKARVKDLREHIVSLREGLDALLDAAFAAAPEGEGRTGNPSEADLSGLDAIEQEVDAMVAAAGQPTTPRLEPSLEERRLIAAQSRQAVGGLTADMVRLARIERAEKAAGRPSTDFARGIPPELLDAAEARAAEFGTVL